MVADISSLKFSNFESAADMENFCMWKVSLTIFHDSSWKIKGKFPGNLHFFALIQFPISSLATQFHVWQVFPDANNNLLFSTPKSRTKQLTNGKF